MYSINFALLSNHDIATQFGKKGTSTDLTLYDKKDSDVLRTWIVPSGFPDKIQPLLQAINMSEYIIFYVNKLDRFTGEQIIALDSLNMTQGILCHSFDVDETKLLSMIRGTVLERYELVKQDDLKSHMMSFPQVSSDTNRNLQMIIDHSFEVKGVGTVVLGKVMTGQLKQYDNLVLLPSGKKVMVKSIQMHDDPCTVAQCPARVGLSLKGIKSTDINRGDILASCSLNVTKTFHLDLKKSPFYTKEISINQMCLVCVGLQIRSARFISISPVTIETERPLVLESDSICIVLKPESQTSRILGSGVIQHIEQ